MRPQREPVLLPAAIELPGGSFDCAGWHRSAES